MLCVFGICAQSFGFREGMEAIDYAEIIGHILRRICGGKMPYIHELPQWPEFSWDMDVLAPLLAKTRFNQGLLLGKMNNLGFSSQALAGLETLAQEVVKSHAIEGAVLDTQEVRSSLARRLGVDIGGLRPANRHIDGIVELMLDATQNYSQPLTPQRLFEWHRMLFPHEISLGKQIEVGRWRTDSAGAMQVVSGYVGREKVHFVAPIASRIDQEMKVFLDWFDSPNPIDPVLKAGIAHFWFVTIHPFEDGNGRIARALADCQLARADGLPQRFYSMSKQIEQERKEYYAILERTQKGGLDITPWLEWFLGCLTRALKTAGREFETTMWKAKVWQYANQFTINERQRRILNRLLDGFTGKLTSSKYAKIAKCSQDTALRDIRQLMDFGILIQSKGGGRSTSYELNELQDFS